MKTPKLSLTNVKVLFITINLVILAVSCQTDEPSIISRVTTSIDKPKHEFGKSLSIALTRDPIIRGFLKKEAIRMFDGDFDILYSLVKDQRLGTGKTFEETLAPHFGGIDRLRMIERESPLLTIFIPTLPENSFSAEKWDSESQVPFVAIRLSTTNDVPIISPEGEEYVLDSELIPSYPVIVIKENERVMYSGQPGYEQMKSSRELRNSDGLNFKFVDDLYDTELQAEKSTNNLRDVLDSQIDQKLHDAFSIYSSVDGWHRDYIYYNISSTNPSGPFRYDFLETIRYFNIVGDARAVYNTMADQTGDPRIKEGKNNSGWTEGAFEIRAHVLVQSRIGTGPNISNAALVSGGNLFAVTYNVEKRGVWPFRYDYYTIRTVTSKPQNTNLSIVNWDLNRYATAFRVDIEESDNTEIVTSSSTETTEFATNFEFNVGFGTDVKIGQKFGASQKETRSSTVTRQATLLSDRLGEFIVNFEDKIITQEYVLPYQNPDSYARIRDYSNGTITINVEPRRVQ